ncbi:MAG: HU family DNA-binding protein [Bacteriovoracaceae bacterium]|nr:HU family DNA-binding protein [Bacteriovoracaceae bacterium]
MNKKELIEATLSRVQLPSVSKKETEILLNTLIDVIKENVANGSEVTLKDFGTFTLVHHRERRGFNPVTGEEMMISSRTFPKFRPGKGWVEMVGNEKSLS